MVKLIGPPPNGEKRAVGSYEFSAAPDSTITEPPKK